MIRFRYVANRQVFAKELKHLQRRARRNQNSYLNSFGTDLIAGERAEIYEEMIKHLKDLMGMQLS